MGFTLPMNVALKLSGLNLGVYEYKFHPTRHWRFDFAWPELKLALEIEGGTRINGRHNRHKGYEADCEKYNEAQLMGWIVLRVTSEMVNDGRALRLIERALKEIPKLRWSEQ